MEKYSRSRQATNDNIKRRMSFASSINKATDTHSEYAILIAFPRQKNGYVKASQSDIIRKLRVLLTHVMGAHLFAFFHFPSTLTYLKVYLIIICVTILFLKMWNRFL